MGDGGEKTVKQYEWGLKEKQITQEPTYIVWEVVTANILGLFSSSTPCYVSFCSSLVLTRVCGGSLFGTLFFDIQFLTLPRSKYSSVSWLDWSPAAGKTRPQQRIQRARKLSLYITGSWYHVQLQGRRAQCDDVFKSVCDHDRSAMLRDGRAVLKQEKAQWWNRRRYG